jgi:hypothetical protein
MIVASFEKTNCSSIQVARAAFHPKVMLAGFTAMMKAGLLGMEDFVHLMELHESTAQTAWFKGAFQTLVD